MTSAPAPLTLAGVRRRVASIPFTYRGIACDIKCCGHVWRFRVYTSRGPLEGLRATRKEAVTAAKMRAGKLARRVA